MCAAPLKKGMICEIADYAFFLGVPTTVPQCVPMCVPLCATIDVATHVSMSVPISVSRAVSGMCSPVCAVPQKLIIWKIQTLPLFYI